MKCAQIALRKARQMLVSGRDWILCSPCVRQYLPYILTEAGSIAFLCWLSSIEIHVSLVRLHTDRARCIAKHTPSIFVSARMEMFLALLFSEVALIGLLAFNGEYMQKTVLPLVLLGIAVPLFTILFLRRKTRYDNLVLVPISFGIVLLFAQLFPWEKLQWDQSWSFAFLAIVAYGEIVNVCTEPFKQWPVKVLRSIAREPSFAIAEKSV